MKSAACPLCETPGGVLVFESPKFRVIRADEPDYPAFYRLVWSEHVAEFSDLSDAEQVLCMRAVARVERTLRDILRPTKINLAALGNVVPHLHWHIIARFEGDAHFPAPVWAPKSREPDAACLGAVLEHRDLLERTLVQRLGG